MPKNRPKEKTATKSRAVKKSPIKSKAKAVKKTAKPRKKAIKKPVSRQQKTLIFILSTVVSLILISLTTYAVWKIDSNSKVEPTNSKLVNVMLVPSINTVEVNEEFTISVYVNPEGKSEATLENIQLHLRFDPEKLYIETISKGTPVGKYNSIESKSAIDNTNGRVYIDWEAKDSRSGFRSKAQIATLVVTPKKAGEVLVIVTETSDSGVENELQSAGVLSDKRKAIITAVNAKVNVKQDKDVLLIEDADLSKICSPECESDEYCDSGECQQVPVYPDQSEVIKYPTTPSDDMTYCINDSDCVKTSTTCCECNQGGDEVAINQQSYSKYRSSLGCIKDTYACLDVYRCSDVQPQCVNNKCVIDGLALIPASPAIDDESLAKTDINRDGTTSIYDYAIFTGDLRLCQESKLCDSRSDFDNDGVVDENDYTLFLEYYNIKKS